MSPEEESVVSSATVNGSNEPEYLEKDPTGRYVRVKLFHNFNFWLFVVQKFIVLFLL